MSDTGAPAPRRVAVAGAGLMGSGIAAVLVKAGYAVDLYDTAPEGLARGRARGEKHAGELGAALTTQVDLEVAVCAADLGLEAVPEVLELKREVFARVDAAAPDHAVLATNTSELSVTAIAAATKRPE